MPQQSPDPADRFEWFRTPAGRRVAGIGAALLLEALLLLLLSSLGIVGAPGGEKKPTLVSFTASEDTQDAPEPAQRAESEPQPQQAPAPKPTQPPQTPLPPQPQTAPPQPAAPAPVAIPAPRPAPSSTDVYPRPIQAVPPGARSYGPVDNGSASAGDSARVGTAPNGEPLYAAKWYREPYEDELRGYLSTATGPGWGLIACRTAPDFRVEDCVPIEESPRGSMINRAILAAAWQFKVRPPRRGGQSLVGAWVRIRIDYDLKPAAR